MVPTAAGRRRCAAEIARAAEPGKGLGIAAPLQEVQKLRVQLVAMCRELRLQFAERRRQAGSVAGFDRSVETQEGLFDLLVGHGLSRATEPSPAPVATPKFGSRVRACTPAWGRPDFPPREETPPLGYRWHSDRITGRRCARDGTRRCHPLRPSGRPARH